MQKLALVMLLACGRPPQHLDLCDCTMKGQTTVSIDDRSDGEPDLVCVTGFSSEGTCYWKCFGVGCPVDCHTSGHCP